MNGSSVGPFDVWLTIRARVGTTLLWTLVSTKVSSKGTNRVGVPSPHLNKETEPLSERMCYLSVYLQSRTMGKVQKPSHCGYMFMLINITASDFHILSQVIVRKMNRTSLGKVALRMNSTSAPTQQHKSISFAWPQGTSRFNSVRVAHTNSPGCWDHSAAGIYCVT
jgi:hypothetical protein